QMKHPAGIVAAYGQSRGGGTADIDALAEDQFAAGQSDGTAESRREADGIRRPGDKDGIGDGPTAAGVGVLRGDVRIDLDRADVAAVPTRYQGSAIRPGMTPLVDRKPAAVTAVNGHAAGQRHDGHGRSAVVLQWAEQGVDRSGFGSQEI